VVYDLGQAAAAGEVRRGAGAEEIRQQKLAVFVEEAGERPWEEILAQQAAAVD